MDLREKVRRFILVTTLLAVVTSLAFVLTRISESMAANAQKKRDRDAYAELSQIAATRDADVCETPAPATPTDAVKTPFVSPIAFRSLHDINENIVGWLRIPDLSIDYPIVQTSDNAFYLTHGFDRESNSAGALFLDCLNQPDFQMAHNVVYGHNMRDGTMFAKLRLLLDRRHFQKHSAAYLFTPTETVRLKLFAVRVVPLDYETLRTFAFESPEEEAGYWRNETSQASLALENIPPAERFLTLMTCVDNERLLVHYAMLPDADRAR